MGLRVPGMRCDRPTCSGLHIRLVQICLIRAPRRPWLLSVVVGVNGGTYFDCSGCSRREVWVGKSRVEAQRSEKVEISRNIATTMMVRVQ